MVRSRGLWFVVVVVDVVMVVVVAVGLSIGRSVDRSSSSSPFFARSPKRSNRSGRSQGSTMRMQTNEVDVEAGGVNGVAVVFLVDLLVAEKGSCKLQGPDCGLVVFVLHHWL